MPTAWQVREYQRQQLIEELSHNFYQKEINQETFSLELVSVIIGYLQDREKGILEPDFKKDAAGTFLTNSLSAITDFARTKAESDVLVIKFLKSVLDCGLSQFYTELNRQEFHYPEQIFNAPSAMSEVPIKGESP